MRHLARRPAVPMNAPALPTNVVGFPRRTVADPSSPGASGLLGQLQSRGQEILGTALDAAFQAADDDLFRRSEQNPALFDGLRELRRRQAFIARRFLEKLAQEGSPSPPPRTAVFEGGLSLVEDGQLEEALAVSRMTAAAQSTHAGELHVLRQRLAVLRGGVNPDTVNVPLAPAAVAEAFQGALEGLDEIDLALRIVLYKHFEQHTMAALGLLYRQVNQDLGEAGVLPGLRPQAMRASEAGDSASSAALSGAPPPGQPAAWSPEEQTAWNDFRQVLAAHRAPGSGGQGPAANLRDLTEAIAALRELQAMLSDLTPTGAAPRDIKHRLLERLGQGTTDPKSLGQHEDAIDAVGLMFEHILADAALPAAVQAVLARLHVPFLKVAVVDPAVFARSDHPARRLLDLLGEAGRGWSPDTDRDQAWLGRMRSTVEAINQEFEDPEIFERQRLVFEAFLREHAQRASGSTQRAQDAARQREHLEQAQAGVAAAIGERTAGQPLPGWARALLLRHWAGFMVWIAVREGLESAAFSKALYFVDQVVQAPQPKDVAGRRALATVAPVLVRQMREGLATVGMSATDVQGLAETLEAYLASQAGGTPPPTVEAPLPPLPALDRPAVRSSPNASPAALATVGRWKLDDWLEFDDAKGQTTRGKIAWVSATTGKILLVSLGGARLAEKSREELAAMVEVGSVRFVEEKPLFGRALDSIRDRLRR